MSNTETKDQWPVTLEVLPVADKLRELGLISTAGGVQIDINTVPKRLSVWQFEDGHRCDHNCLRIDGSGYDCPASSTINKGLSGKFPPMDRLAQATLSAADGVRIANEILQKSGYFEHYCEEFDIPTDVAHSMIGVMNDGTIQINEFGGNPEMYDHLFDLITEVHQKDPRLVFNLTTTGRKALTRPGWVDQLMNNPVDSLALSCDNIDVELLRDTNTMSNEDLHLKWKSILKDSPNNGSRQKAVEALFTARELTRVGKPFIFNLVMHPGNLEELGEIMYELSTQFPLAQINPFPAQSSMDGTSPTFSQSDLPMFEKIVDWALAVHTDQSNSFPLVPRAHYWLMLKAALEFHRDDPDEALRAISGYNVWDCYQHIGAARYVQIGASNKPWGTNKEHAGGHLSCFWNPSVTMNEVQVWNQTPQEVSSYITKGIKDIAASHQSACAGCIMPRLTFDLYSQEVGMNRALKPTYLALRKMHIGF